MAERVRETPLLVLIALLAVLAAANVPRAVFHGMYTRGFFTSCALIVALMALFAVGMFPFLVRSNPCLENSLDLYNAASSHRTLAIMLVIAAVGMPLVVLYTTVVYLVFRGKVGNGETDY